MSLRDIPVTTLEGRDTTLAEYGPVLLIVNVASHCGHTPQYAALQELHERYGDRGLSVLGFPCNQFMFQEPGSAETIREFCTVNYGVTFPLFAKVKVNGHGAHPLFAELTRVPDAEGQAGKVGWNFEKFLVSPRDEVRRYRSATVPDAPEIVAALEEFLPA